MELFYHLPQLPKPLNAYPRGLEDLLEQIWGLASVRGGGRLPPILLVLLEMPSSLTFLVIFHVYFWLCVFGFYLGFNFLVLPKFGQTKLSFLEYSESNKCVCVCARGHVAESR